MTKMYQNMTLVQLLKINRNARVKNCPSSGISAIGRVLRRQYRNTRPPKRKQAKMTDATKSPLALPQYSVISCV